MCSQIKFHCVHFTSGDKDKETIFVMIFNYRGIYDQHFYENMIIERVLINLLWKRTIIFFCVSFRLAIWVKKSKKNVNNVKLS